MPARPKSSPAQPRRLMTIDDSKRRVLQQRLARIAGQIGAIQRMVDEGRYCIDVLEQVGSAHEALRGVARIVMRNYLESCATDAIRSADSAEAQRIYDELMDQLFKHAR